MNKDEKRENAVEAANDAAIAGQAISDDELNHVVGGSHLSSDEAKALTPGQRLIVEDDLGNDLAEAIAWGGYVDPGSFYMLRPYVQIVKAYSKDNCFTLDGETYYEGQVYCISRYNLDYYERA